jgi:hypothetical protein
MTTPLSVEHVAAGFHAAARLYNQPLDHETAALIYAVLMKAAPSMTAELFDHGLQKAMESGRFMPRIVDILEACYERDTSGLPKMPDIDPRYADAYLQGIFYRAEQYRHSALSSAPVDTSRPKAACRHLAELTAGAGADPTITLSQAKAILSGTTEGIELARRKAAASAGY